MKAGRELDRLLAEKIFGIVINEYMGSSGHVLTEWGWASKAIEAYSTDLKSAWKIVNAIIDCDRDGVMHFEMAGPKEYGWLARFYAADRKGFMLTSDHYGKSLSPSHAICLAALGVLNGT